MFIKTPMKGPPQRPQFKKQSCWLVNKQLQRETIPLQIVNFQIKYLSLKDTMSQKQKLFNFVKNL